MDRKTILKEQKIEKNQEETYITENVENSWLKPLEESFYTAKNYIEFLQKRDEELIAENKRLKDEHFKDEELLRLAKELEKAEYNLEENFTITKKEQKEIENWQAEHEKKRHSIKTEKQEKKLFEKSLYVYTFAKTELGTRGFCECESCKAEALIESNGNIERYKRLGEKYDVTFRFR